MSSFTRVLIVSLAGFGFGAWPLVMKQASLSAGALALTYSAFSLVASFALFAFIGGFAIGASADVVVRWQWAIAASLIASVAFVGMSIVFGQTSVTPKELGRLYMIMLLMQLSVPALVTITSGHSSLKQCVGIGLAFLAAVLLG